MPSPIDKPILTRLHQGWNSFVLESGSTYIHGTSVEERSIHPKAWEQAAIDVDFISFAPVESTTGPDFSNCNIEAHGKTRTIPLRSGEQLRAFFLDLESEMVYLDITGLPHHIWAPLIRAAMSTPVKVSGVYVEPRSYSFSPTPTEAEIFDLSEAIHGIHPLPGFGVLSEPEDEDSVLFVPFLGFEGHRLAYVLEQIQPPGRKIFPVVGVPGFMPVFPFHTYLGNRNILGRSNLHTQVRHIMANSAVDAFYLLQEISRDYPQDMLKVAPIGTKPHALGAVLFALWDERSVEIVYDHPIRKPNRTIGSANILVYDIDHLRPNLPA